MRSISINNRSAARKHGALGEGLRFCGPLLTLLLLFLASTAHCASLDPSVMQLFPKNVTEIGYADLDDARSLPWFPQFAAQVVPVSLYGFDQFLAAAQMQSTSSIDQVVWVRFSSSDELQKASGASLLAGVATGKFQVDAIKSFLKAQRVPSVQLDDTVAYSAENGNGAGATYFTFLDQNTIAFGSTNALKRLLSVRDGYEDSLSENETMIDDIDRVNGGIFWGVLGSEDAQKAVEGLMPVLRAFPQSRDLAGQISQVAIGATDTGTIQLNFQATIASAKDSILFSQLLQAGLLYGQYQANSANPDLAKILSGVAVSPDGNELDISLSLTDDQMLSLIEHNTFSLSF